MNLTVLPNLQVVKLYMVETTIPGTLYEYLFTTVSTINTAVVFISVILDTLILLSIGIR